jgi:TolA-binding protein
MRYPPFSNIFTACLLVLVCTAVLRVESAQAQIPPSSAEARFADAVRLRSSGLLHDAFAAFSSFHAAHPEHVQAATALYYQAELALQLERVDEAVSLFTRFREDYPAHPLAFEAQVILGTYFLEAGETERAVALIEQVLDQRPPPELAARALYGLGEAAYRRGDFDDAVTYYRRAAEGYRETETAPVALYAIGFTHMRQERYQDAGRAFEQLAQRYPASPYARIVGIALAEVYYETGEYQRAVEEFERRLPGLNPEAAARATFLLAESYNQLRDSENAIVYYNRVVEAGPSNPYFRRAQYGLGWNYYQESMHEWAAEQFAAVREGHDDDLAARAAYYEGVNLKLDGRTARAVERFEDMVFRWPNHELAAHAQLEMAIGLYDQRQWRAAHDAFGQVLRTYPGSDVIGEATFYRGNAAVALGNYEEAQQLFERAAELGSAPQELLAEMHFQKAWLMYRNRQYADAARAFSERLQADPRGPRAEESLFWAAESNYQLERYNEAERLFRQYVREYPSGSHADAATYALGWTYFRAARYEEAANAFSRFLGQYQGGSVDVPYRADAQLRLGDSYYALRRFPEAIRAYQRALADGHDYALYQIGQAYYNSGNSRQAISSFERLISEHPDGEWVQSAMYSIGYIQLQDGQFDDAIATYRRLIQRYPQDPLAARAQYGIGDAYFNAGRHTEAARAYQTVLERYSNSPYVADAAAGMQYALTATGDETRMTAVIDSFAARNPASPVVAQLRFRQAEVKYQSGRRDEALADFLVFAEAHRQSPQLPDAHFYIASVYETRGDEARARDYYQRVVRDHAASAQAPEAAWRLGNLHLERNQHREALEAFRAMGRMQTRDAAVAARAHYGEGIALLNLGQTQEAERLLRAAVEGAGDSDAALPAMLGLARVYEQTNRRSEAMDLYRRVGERSRDEMGAEALFRLGSLHLAANNFQTAIETFSRIPVLYPGFEDWVARSYLAQARSFSRMGQSGEAARVYDRVIAEFRGTPYAETAARERAAL